MWCKFSLHNSEDLRGKDISKMCCAGGLRYSALLSFLCLTFNITICFDQISGEI